MNYVNGFVAPVPVANKQQYIAHCKKAAAVFKEYGAIELVECWGDDVPAGETTSFPLAVKCKADEVVCFSWIKWPSKEVHDEVIHNVMQDPRLSNENNPMPFDGKRMIYGGFQMIVCE